MKTAAAIAALPAAHEPLAVRCRGVTKSFRTSGGTVWALRGVDLDVAEGRITMLVGPSGCGKTTLISVIAGTLHRDAGRCMVLGQDLEALPMREHLDFRARNIGFIFQQFHLLPSLSIADNVAIPLLINGATRKAAVAAAADLLAKVGLNDRGGDKPAGLSGGEQQRAAIARALVHRPRLVVCDEPTSALDHETGHRIMALMQDIVRSEATTLLIVTHDNRIFPFADRIARMDDGRILTVEDRPLGAVAP